MTSKKAFQGTDSVRLHLGDPGYDRRLNLSKANPCLSSLICQILQNKTFFITSFTLKFSAQQEIFEVEFDAIFCGTNFFFFEYSVWLVRSS